RTSGGTDPSHASVGSGRALARARLRTGTIAGSDAIRGGSPAEEDDPGDPIVEGALAGARTRVRSDEAGCAAKHLYPRSLGARARVGSEATSGADYPRGFIPHNGARIAQAPRSAPLRVATNVDEVGGSASLTATAAARALRPALLAALAA